MRVSDIVTLMKAMKSNCAGTCGDRQLRENAMANRHRLTPTNRAGFTLLELLMVVIIIGILTSIALPQYIRVSERARASEAMIILSAIRSSEMRYRAEDSGNSVTTNLNLLDVDTPGFGAPASNTWNYSANATHAIATRSMANGGLIYQNLSSGCTSSNNNIYGIPTTIC